MYCTKCGKQNDDDAAFCKHCGAPLMGVPPQGAAGQEWERRGRRAQNECDNECQRGNRGYSWIWGVIVIFIGLWVIVNWALPNIDMPGMRDMMSGFDFWWVIPLLIGLLIISIGARMIMRRGQAK